MHGWYGKEYLLQLIFGEGLLKLNLQLILGRQHRPSSAHNGYLRSEDMLKVTVRIFRIRIDLNTDPIPDPAYKVNTDPNSETGFS